MHSRARVMGHAAHPVLVVFPLGLLATAVIFDIVRLIAGGNGFAVSAGYLIAAGLIGGVIAGLFGFIDWTGIPAGTRAKRVGAIHGIGNVLVLVLFAISWLLRTGADNWVPGVWAMLFGFAGLVLAGVTGWLGGELVERLAVGVDEGADVNAPSSLKRQHPMAAR